MFIKRNPPREDESRKTIFRKFWKISTLKAKKGFIYGLVDRRQPRRRRPTTDKDSAIKKYGYDCFLPKIEDIKVLYAANLC